MKRFMVLIIFIFLLAYGASGQPALTLQECYERAESNYPLIHQRWRSRKYSGTPLSDKAIPDGSSGIVQNLRAVDPLFPPCKEVAHNAPGLLKP